MRAEEGEGGEGADPAEAEARRHYRPIQTSGRVSSEAQWKNRVASGCPRVDKVEQMTLVERIEALTPKNVAILLQLADIGESDRGKKVSHLTTSASRLENFEFIERDKSRELGWKVTEFGRYAVEVRSSQTV
ncbi:hypothetical protein N7U49_21190 [Streptomyces sp. AD2-2]|nr:hypothetical protein N7U49_21190 [Streptomyces sp. AD2-2]